MMEFLDIMASPLKRHCGAKAGVIANLTHVAGGGAAPQDHAEVVGEKPPQVQRGAVAEFILERQIFNVAGQGHEGVAGWPDVELPESIETELGYDGGAGDEIDAQLVTDADPALPHAAHAVDVCSKDSPVDERQRQVP